MNHETTFALYAAVIAVSGSVIFCGAALLGGFLNQVDKRIKRMTRRELMRRKKYTVLTHSK